MSDTARLALPRLSAAQAQKHVTHNDALQILDALVHLSVRDRNLAAPPAAPANGDRYLVAAGASGAWTGRAGQIASFDDGLWRFHAPMRGWIAHVEDENGLLVFDGTGWSAMPGLFARLGVNAAADAANRVVIAAANLLVTDEGAGVQVKVNKTGAGATGSYLFQQGYSGRAEFGLVGGDDVKLKVSPDGSTWTEVLGVSRTTRVVSFGDADTGIQAGVPDALPLVAGGQETARVTPGRVTVGAQAPVAFGGLSGAIALHMTNSAFGSLDLASWLSGAFTRLRFLRARGGAAGGFAAVVNGDTLMRVEAHGADGTQAVYGGGLAMQVDGAPAAGTVPTRLHLATADASGAVDNRLTVKNDGEVQHRGGATTVVDAASHLGLRSYTVATLPSAATAARLIYVSNGAGNRRLAVSDGAAWRWPDGAVVS